MNQKTLTHLQQLEADSIHIMREVVAETENPVMLIFNRKRLFCIASFGEKSILSCKNSISSNAC